MHQPSIVLIQLIVTSYTTTAPEHRKKAIRPNKAVHIEARLHYTSPRTQHMWPLPGPSISKLPPMVPASRHVSKLCLTINCLNIWSAKNRRNSRCIIKLLIIYRKPMSNFRILPNITYRSVPHIVILGVTIPTSAGKRKLTLYKTTAGAPRQ